MHLKIPEKNTSNRMGPKGKSRGCDPGLFLECVDEELSEAQVSFYNKAMSHYRETNASIDNLTRTGIIDVLERGRDYVSLEFKEGINGMNNSKLKGPLTPVTVSRAANSVSQPNASLLLQNSPGAPSGGTYQIVMDPRSLGLYVSSGATQVTAAPATVMAGVIQPNPPPLAATISSPVVSPSIRPTSSVGLPTAIRSIHPSRMTAIRTPTSVIRPQRAIRGPAPSAGKPAPAMPAPSASARGSAQALRIRPTTAKEKATEASSVGGIVQNQKKSAPTNTVSAVVVDLTEDESNKNNMAADSREVMFNKLSGKTYPSLVVVARPNLRSKEITQAQITAERTALDGKMKTVLMGTPTKFTEWLIQQGLVRSEQYCSIHVNPDMSPIKLKLGMYSDVSKFPYSGGYVWISECCPQRFVSVFSGSIFEGAPHAPTVLVKLLYHWSVQTSVSNISSWVKVDGLYVKSFFTNIRAVCTAAVYEKFEKLGGPKKRVELGVISLGTTSQDGNMRQVKVEVLGVYDPESKLIRLRAVEPLQDGERNYKRRFVKILEPLDEWVHKESIILTDYTVDKGTLHQMGYQSVYQVTMNDQQGNVQKYSNAAVMDYLRRIVPRMFQNTLSLLSRQMIQQFLDELVWRERWGSIPARAFEIIISHLAEQTKLDTGDTLMTRLNKIAANPFKNWAYKNWQVNCSPTVAPPVTRFVVGTSEPVPIQPPSLPPQNTLPSIDNLPPSLRTAETTQEVQPNTSSNSAKRGRKSKSSPTAEPDAKRRAPPLTSPSTNLCPIDSYYYGTIPASEAEEKKQITLNQECVICRMVIKDNLKMMRHLIGHAFNDSSYTFSDSSPQCRYCLKDFLSEFALQSHIEETHEKGSLVCLICRESNRDRTLLIMHMHHNHNEQELPYQCSHCGYRSSEHCKTVDHFYEEHKNSDKLQCPFCLKIVSLQTVDGRKITQNQYFFFHHIQKHQRKTLARKCNKCVLWFVHKDLIKEHITKDHTSCKEHPRLKRYPVDGIDAVMMPTPMGSGGPAQPKSQSSKIKHSLLNTFTVNNFPSLELIGVNDTHICCECEGEVMQEEHYPGFLSCLKCRFSTCCNKAMNEHFVVHHDKAQSKPMFNVGKVSVLSKPLFCVCGFSSKSGNKLAYHLAVCKRKSAYPSTERAAQSTLQGQSASFPPLVTLDEEEDSQNNAEKWMRAFTQPRTSIPASENSETVEKSGDTMTTSGDPPSMLNLLGLRRKASTDESSQDKQLEPAGDSPDNEDSK